THARIVERRTRSIENDRVRLQHWILEHAELRIACNERGHGGRDSGEVELAAREPRELGCRLVDDDDDESPDERRAAERARKVIVARELPPLSRNALDESERPIADR